MTNVTDDMVNVHDDNNSNLENNTQTAETDESTQHSEMIPAHIKLTGRMLNFSRLHIQGNDIVMILQKVKQKLGKQLHSQLPVVISCEHEVMLDKLLDGLWDLGLQPIGVVTGVLDEQAHAQKVAIFPADGQRIDGIKISKQTTDITNKQTKETIENQTSQDKENQDHHAAPQMTENITISAEKSDIKNDKPETSTPSQNMADEKERFHVASQQTSYLDGDLVCQHILRSGQSINHVGGDVILTQGINAGAEAITDYSLHIYGKAEGRLVAGATGDKNAKIFCLKFNPSLVSVAGTYCLKENIPTELINQAVQVHYDDEKGLVFQRMC